MKLESLSNELLLDVFESLSVVQLLQAFRGLNARFDTLLLAHLQVCGHLDFRRVSKRDFDLVCRQHLRSVVERVISLRLSDDDDTPQQIDLFLAHGFALHQFVQLQSLTLDHATSYETTMRMIDELRHLPCLTHLNFIENHFSCDDFACTAMLDAIWNLPTLTHLHLCIDYYRNERLFPKINAISSSLEYVAIKKFNVGLTELDHLFQHTPRLRHLHVLLLDRSAHQELSCSMPSMKTLKLVVKDSLPQLLDLLQNLPNLDHLKAETRDVQLNGQQWEQIITEHLPKLRIFQLKMHVTLDDEDDQSANVDRWVDSFRTSFWLDQHRWPVRCHSVQECCLNGILLYTLPYAFNHFDPMVNIASKSTCSRETDHWSYDRVHSLIYRTPQIHESSPSLFRFANTHRLYLSLPSNDHVLSAITSFAQLTSLELALHDGDDDDGSDRVQTQLQSLLDRAPRLYSIAVRSWSDSQSAFVDMTSASIRRLELQGYDDGWVNERWFNDEQCARLWCSPLGAQCEVLLIRLEHQATILDLLNRMTRLRALNTRCRDDTFKASGDQLPFKEDALVNWLKERSPSAWAIARDPIGFVRMWIR